MPNYDSLKQRMRPRSNITFSSIWSFCSLDYAYTSEVAHYGGGQLNPAQISKKVSPYTPAFPLPPKPPTLDNYNLGVIDR